MDSGNSSSMQSSSGGAGGGDQEEYDSRADQSISALFNNNNNNNNTTTVSSNIAVPTQLDSLIANYFNTSWSTDNPLWSTTATKPADGSRPVPPPILTEPVFFTNPLQQNLRTVPNTNTTSPICSVPTDKKNGLATTRNPKKRSRVSRRAPTTVLTTDTSNFRAMVQEFTGNPSTPFTGLSSSSPYPRSRFDLFGSSSSSSSSSRPLKPFPHKLISPSTVNHHYLPPSEYHLHHHHHQHQNLLLNMNTQNIAYPFLNNQSPNNNPLPDQSLLCEKSKPSSLRTSNGFGHVDVGTNFEGLHNIIVSSSSMTQPTLNNTNIHGSDKNTEAENDNDLLRSINGDDQSMVQRSSDGYTAPVASGSENTLAAVRNEGMVELSWISSSD
ncbi:PREDICTED: GATA zinc finger domain-containing protein 11-like isoform X2 [Camelina sativa]|uniref:GATA zinc finger domain-containing protein 11-like isoform X2 n=1 Tax=Camelina sativa TaxID=90675 RepID=A0ABM0UQC7_CAMSA|nr:PREDICTED: GATA zinc finger domain-containing protein 11-like isoform X2 [Camelina sativa]